MSYPDIIQFCHVFSFTNLLVISAGLVYGTFFRRLTGLSPAIAVISLLPLLSALHATPYILINLLLSIMFGSELLADRRNTLKAYIAAFVLLAAVTAAYMLNTFMVQNLSSSDKFAVIIFALTAYIVFSEYHPLKAVITICIGILIATVGVDSSTGVLRATYGEPELFDGINFITVAVAVYIISTIYGIISGTEEAGQQASADTSKGRMLFSAVLGGLIPNIAKRSAYQDHPFYKLIFIVISLLPLLAVGIPVNGNMAIILGAMTSANLSPVASVQDMTGAFLTVFLSVFIVIALVGAFNTFFSDKLNNIRKIPDWLTGSALMVIAFAGVYSSMVSIVSVFICFILGTAVYFLRTQGYPRHLILIGFIMSSPMESNLRRALAISNGDISILFSGSLTLFFWFLAAAVSVSAIYFKRG